jgi:hypothetical protein
VTPLERELAALRLDLAPVPDLAPRVRAAIVRRRRRRRAAVLGALAVSLSIASAAVASPSRSALLDWLGLGGLTIERVAELPPADLRTAEAFGTPAALDEARDAVDFRVRLPELGDLGERHVYLDRSAPSPIVTVVYGIPERPRLLLSEWRGDAQPHFRKLIDFSVHTERVRIEGASGIWIEGAPHEIFYSAGDGTFENTPVYTFGNVLVWVRDGVTHRVELDGSLADAREVAESLD